MPTRIRNWKRYLTAEQVAKRLTISVDTLNRLVKSGEFPGPFELSPGTKAFTEDHLTYYRLRVKFRPFFAGGKGEAEV